MNAKLFNFHAAGASLHTTSALPWICQNQQAPAHLGFHACLGTREGVQPHMCCAAIITVAASVEAPIIPCLALRDQTGSMRVLSGADLSLHQLVPCLAKKHGASNHWFKREKLYSGL